MRCGAVQCSAVLCVAVQRGAVRCVALQCGAGDAKVTDAVVVVASVGVLESERNGEALGLIGVGPKAIGLFKSVFGQSILLETRKRETGTTCTIAAPANCHLLCFCATAVDGEGQGASTTPYLLGAAPVGPATFFVGLYIPKGGIRLFPCPHWVSTLQAAELWG